jgi:hypothetical protein
MFTPERDVGRHGRFRLLLRKDRLSGNISSSCMMSNMNVREWCQSPVIAAMGVRLGPRCKRIRTLNFAIGLTTKLSQAFPCIRTLKSTLTDISDRPKTDFVVSAENEYSARKCCRIFGRWRIFGTRHQNVNLYKEQNGFLGCQLKVAVDGHDLWAN